MERQEIVLHIPAAWIKTADGIDLVTYTAQQQAVTLASIVLNTGGKYAWNTAWRWDSHLTLAEAKSAVIQALFDVASKPNSP